MVAQTDFDCVIVGGGLVGATLALALAPLGLRVALIEAVQFDSDAQPSLDARGLALSLSSTRILETLGLWPALRDAATPIERVHVSDQGCFGFTQLSAADVNLPAVGHVVIARELGAVLLAELEQRQGATIFCPARVSAVSVSDAQATLTVDADDGEQRLSTRLVIAADGADSATRRMLGVGATYQDYEQVAFVATVGIEHEHNNTAYERFTASGPLAVLPLAGRRCGVVLTVDKDDAAGVESGGAQRFCALASERFAWRLGEFRDAGRLSRYTLRRVLAESRVGPRFVVIGNAAQTVHPNAAQGFNLGLRQSALLGETLVRAVRQDIDPGSLDHLRSYAAASERDRRRVTSATHGLATLFYNGFPLFAVVRNVAMLSIDFFPPMKRAVITSLAGLGSPQPRLVRGLPL